MDYKGSTKQLISYGIFGFPLAFLGLPLYIHLPKIIHDHFGASLAAIGIILLVLRLFDAFLDPLLGILSDRFCFNRKKFFIIFSSGLVIFFNSYFYIPKDSPQLLVLLWFAMCTFFVYGFFSILHINFYSLGLFLGNTDSNKTKLSSFRESFTFLGMITASILPAVLTHFLKDEVAAFKVFGLCFGCFIVVALFLFPNTAIQTNKIKEEFTLKTFFSSLKYVYQNTQMRQLIILFFINSLPVAITSNLFSFYTEQTLIAKSYSPLFLLCYLLTASISALLFSVTFKNSNKIYLLLAMMGISAIGFSCTYFLNAENSYLFFGICILTGFGFGGEVVILPIIAAKLLEKHTNYGSTFFGIWASCTKMSLAAAAGIFLPLISNSDKYLSHINLDNKIAFFYAIIPLFIKCFSVYLVFRYIINKQKEKEHAKV